MSGIIALATILVVPLSPYTVNASSTCSAQIQTNDKSGSHTVGPISASSGTGSCSISGAGRAGQGSPHINGVDAFNDPGFKTGTCTSVSASHAGFDTQFNDGQHSGDGSCSASSYSPYFFASAPTVFQQRT